MNIAGHDIEADATGISFWHPSSESGTGAFWYRTGPVLAFFYIPVLDFAGESVTPVL